MGLLRTDGTFGWTPYAWLIYLAFFFLQPIFDRAGWKEWLATALGTSIFLLLYIAGWGWQGRLRLWIVTAIGFLGLGFAPFNAGAAVFIVYAAALVPFAVDSWPAAATIGALVTAVGAESLLLHLPAWFWIIGTVLPVAQGSVNIHVAQRNRANQRLRMAQDEIQHLARAAERERISRDLHDVLGHTLSVVILKSELASQLIGRDPNRAVSEIRAVEQISRKALAEVRNAISGYRAGSLPEEMARADATLHTAGVAAKCRTVEVPLTRVQETVLVLALREAVTNVVRHARARQCQLSLTQANGDCVLEIQDDGHGGPQSEGNGVRGMRERVETLGGTLRRETSAGTRLTITLPLAAGSGASQSE